LGLERGREDRYCTDRPADHLQDDPTELTGIIAQAVVRPDTCRGEHSSPRQGWSPVLELIVISTLNGVLYGMLLFLMSSGLTLIFSMMGVLNFAHASFYMLGSFFGFQISEYIGFWAGLIVAPVLAGVIGALVERYGLRNVHRHGHVAELLFTFGLAFVMEEVVQVIWGKLPLDYRIPQALDFSAFTFFRPIIQRTKCSCC
jgi:branched-subunit amino acid ABC-type transport system permease component